MAPEYAMEGLFSTKSDVYSFGVMMLEIISGQRNRGFCRAEHDENLVSYAWRVWKEGEGQLLIDQNLVESCPLTEALRWINIALLCVQENPTDRPTMSSVTVVVASFFLEETIIQMYVEASCMAKQPKGGSVRKFATGNAPGSDNATIYALVQCSPDISGQRCYECRNGTGGYCNGRLGARYQNPSCNCGCGISPFYNETPTDALHHSHRLQETHFLSANVMILLAHSSTDTQSDLLGYTCADTGNYTRDSAYNSNLDDVIYSLSTNTTSFSSVSAGSDPDSVNGIALCRGDINQDVCRRCVDDSTRRLRQLCTDQKEAIGWYDDCMVRYSDRSIYQSLETSPDSYYASMITVPDVGTFNKALGTLLGSLRYEAAQGGSALKFASGNVSAPNNMTIYALVQCTPDLTARQCDNCLKGTSWCCDGYTGARYQNPSCNIGYAFTQFYNVSPAAAPPAAAPQALPPPGAAGNKTMSIAGGGRNNTKKIVLITASTLIAAVIAVLGELNDGKEVAVKRLSKNSGQGLKEFKTEGILPIKPCEAEYWVISAIQIPLGLILTTYNLYTRRRDLENEVSCKQVP
ncbi:hypothetical protein RJ640_005494 [Escallonia rubra]|uniref:Cysteine-rich receptor-like protein kinase n=1 Tax=Escallonia rubra TaxID=112253 RepID=A0AA88RKN1_9ASTE|nr:hypothetical protein RJ640_005494 [Escallonia rubra]